MLRLSVVMATGVEFDRDEVDEEGDNAKLDSEADCLKLGRFSNNRTRSATLPFVKKGFTGL